MNYQLLTKFKELFEGRQYRHRSSNQGDLVAMHLFEDLYAIDRSHRYQKRVKSGRSVLNRQNTRHGIKARRGDGTFGESVPGIDLKIDDGFAVGRGPTATIEIGVEVKILAKAMIKQIDRVVTDLGNQVTHFKSRGGTPITVGIAGINWANHYCSIEGEVLWPTNGKRYKHPIQEAAEAERHLRERAAPKFDEFIFLHFIATNEKPFAFTWRDEKRTAMDYGAALARISARYEKL
ncbi:hypothetical protein [Mesorhizobium sp. B2-3-5]|uniref:hypothetical protein n=1 Tax=Mesorhizobium sp. B2-3-5 TaxID=2589958 RepID=UPI001127A602|nr:hypothetical protein [Mesorhizobium sp. B2-3-5]TPM34988.1 hypothetical protein FJ958_07845 [Mesorhizobium sp. B2-3-5]